MATLKFSDSSNVARDKVWDTFWNDDEYGQWTTALYEASVDGKDLVIPENLTKPKKSAWLSNYLEEHETVR